MTFSTHSRKIDGINLGINGQILDTVDTYKNLGLIIDNKLSFQNHIYHVSRQVNYKIRKLKEIRNNIHINTAVTIFKSVIQPHLDYCNIVWDAAGQSLKGKLQEIQEQALEIAYQGVKVNDTNTLHRLSKTLPINERTGMHLAQHVYDITKLPSPVFLKSTIAYTSHTYHTRGKEDKNVKLRKPRTESLRRTVYFRSSLAWNTIPKDLRDCNNKLHFKGPETRPNLLDIYRMVGNANI